MPDINLAGFETGVNVSFSGHGQTVSKSWTGKPIPDQPAIRYVGNDTINTMWQTISWHNKRRSMTLEFAGGHPAIRIVAVRGAAFKAAWG